jgi:hypothetical protein
MGSNTHPQTRSLRTPAIMDSDTAQDPQNAYAYTSHHFTTHARILTLISKLKSTCTTDDEYIKEDWDALELQYPP